jgi:RHS repeat-associated protein
VTDAQTGLTYMQQRYFDPIAGVFLSVDPVAARSMGDNFHRYWYANNNPYRYVDPDGRETAMFQRKEYRMPAPDAATGKAALGLIADFTPGVGDAKGFHDAYQNPTAGNIAGAIIGTVPLVGDVGKAALKQADGAISMAAAIDRGAAHVGADADVILTRGGNVQFTSTSIDDSGNAITRNARFDVNPANRHVQKTGPHVNIETHVNGTTVQNEHLPIQQETIRRGDHE